MSIGNTKTNGNKGNNFPYQLAVLQLLNTISTSSSGGATEATLLQVLAALQSTQEFEQNLVIDLGGTGCPTNCPTYLQIRIWNSVTHTFGPPTYYNAAGTAVVPVGPLELVNPQYTLQLILAQLTSTARTPGLLRVTTAGPGTVTAGFQKVSVYNSGVNNATLMGQTLKAGEVVSYEANKNDTLGAIQYDALTSELLISTLL